VYIGDIVWIIIGLLVFVTIIKTYHYYHNKSDYDGVEEEKI